MAAKRMAKVYVATPSRLFDPTIANGSMPEINIRVGQRSDSTPAETHDRRT
jgi:hypothetical protein